MSNGITVDGEPVGGSGGIPAVHDIITKHDGFPGGTILFLRADGTFAAPAGGSATVPRLAFTTTTDTGAVGVAQVYACTDTTVPLTLTISTATIALGSPTDVFYLTIKDESGGASVNNISIDTETGNIDGTPGVTLKINVKGGFFNLYVDGTDVWGV